MGIESKSEKLERHQEHDEKQAEIDERKAREEQSGDSGDRRNETRDQKRLREIEDAKREHRKGMAEAARKGRDENERIEEEARQRAEDEAKNRRINVPSSLDAPLPVEEPPYSDALADEESERERAEGGDSRRSRHDVDAEVAARTERERTVEVGDDRSRR